MYMVSTATATRREDHTTTSQDEEVEEHCGRTLRAIFLVTPDGHKEFIDRKLVSTHPTPRVGWWLLTFTFLFCLVNPMLLVLVFNLT